MAAGLPDVSIVIPTYREAENLRILLPRLAAAMASTGRPYEVLIMDDDSRDSTDQVVVGMSGECPVQLVVRTGMRDLSLAVLDGLRRARGRLLVVMDADLSHPPEKVPELLARAEQPTVDFVIGSRFVPGGQTQAWGRGRRLNSYLAALLCRPLIPAIHDPMAGFFALRREVFERAAALDPIGYKIGLELICRCRCRHVVELPIVFHNRVHGFSKLTLAQQSRYLTHLDRLYRDCRPRCGILMRPILWAMRGALGLLRAVVPG